MHYIEEAQRHLEEFQISLAGEPMKNNIFSHNQYMDFISGEILQNNRI